MGASVDHAGHSPPSALWSLHTKSQQEHFIPLPSNKWLIAIRVTMDAAVDGLILPMTTICQEPVSVQKIPTHTLHEMATAGIHRASLCLVELSLDTKVWIEYFRSEVGSGSSTSFCHCQCRTAPVVCQWCCDWRLPGPDQPCCHCSRLRHRWPRLLQNPQQLGRRLGGEWLHPPCTAGRL